MQTRKTAEFNAGHRMAGENHLFNRQGREKLMQVFGESLKVVARFGILRVPMPAAIRAEYVVLVGEPRGELVKYVCRAPQSRQE